jgi:hypothetical protein
MKKTALISAIIIGGLFTATANAQIAVSLGFHFRTHRAYEPTGQIAAEVPVYRENPNENYYNDDDYYYLPDVGAYYDVTAQSYYYNDGYNWVSAAYLPGYRDYDWRNARRYEVRTTRPYLHDDFYRSRYEGHAGNWGRNDNAYGNYNRGGYRTQEQRFDNNREWNRQERAQDHGFDRSHNFNQQEQPYRNQGNYGQQYNGGNNQRNYGSGQPTEQKWNQGNNGVNQPSQGNRGQGNYNQPSNDHNRGNYSNGDQHNNNHGQDRSSR